MSNKNSTQTAISQTINTQTLEDTKNAVLVVSLGANLFIFTTWLVVSVAESSVVAMTTLF